MGTGFGHGVIIETHIHTVYYILFSHTWAHTVHYQYKCICICSSPYNDIFYLFIS